MKYRITISKGMAEKITESHIIEDWERPRFGRHWWLWLPVVNHNGGKFKLGEVVDVSVSWLCFWAGLIFWPQGDNS